MTTLTAFAPFAPVVGTLLWVLLIVGLVGWFRKPLAAILAAIQKRIESGSTVKAGWFELSEHVRAQSPSEQRQRMETEIAEVTAQLSAERVQSFEDARPDAATLYLQAEDLALRAVQAEYGVPMTRQVAMNAGRMVEFDGAFVKDRQLHVVEVKTYVNAKSLDGIRRSLERVASAAKEMGGPKTRLIAAIVLRRAIDVTEVRLRMSEVLRDLPVPTDLRVYSLSELRTLLGAPSSDA